MHRRRISLDRLPLGAWVLVGLLACGRDLGSPPRAALLEIAPSAAAIDVAETLRLFASLKDAQGNLISGSHAFVWRSRDVAIATINASGQVTGVAPGTAQVEVSVGALTGSAAITVRNPAPARVVLEPATGSIARGDSLRLQARALAASGTAFTGRRFTFESSNPSAVTVTPDTAGASVRVTAIAPGSATITATNLGVSGTALITVLPDPVISFASPVVAFQAAVGGADPATQALRVQNAGSGTLRGLEVGGISYGTGQPTGWLRAAFPVTPATGPVDLQLTASVVGLTTGSYTATVLIRSTQPGVAESRLTVTFTVSPPPVLVLSATSLSFSGAAGGANPPAQTIAVTNGVAGALNGLAVSTPVTGTGQPAPWVTAVLGSSAAPTSITVSINTAGLAVGTYSASMSVSAPNAQSSPRTVSLTLTVSQNAIIVLTPASVARTAQVGAPPTTGVIAVTNGGGATLAGLSLGPTQYGAGQPTGWLIGRLVAPQAPTQIDLTLGAATLPLGTYTATFQVLSSQPGVPAVTATVTLMVSVAPVIVANPASVSMTAAGGANPGVELVNISNAGGGTLSGLAAAVSYPQGQLTGWLSASFPGGTTTAPTTLALQSSVLTLPVGSYTATVTLTAPNATGPLAIPVSLTVPGSLQAGSLSALLSAAQGVGVFAPGSITLSSDNPRPIAGLAVSVLTPGATWVQASLSGTTTPATLQIGSTAAPQASPRGPIAGSAVVRVSGNSVSPVDITVSRRLIYTYNQHIENATANIHFFSVPTVCGSCHGSFQKPTQFSYGYLTSTFSNAQPALRYVNAGSTNPAASYLYVKLSTTGDSHKGRWTSTQEGIVRDWLSDGARLTIP
ncbi:MAG: Ig-like domain-containing protein [Gemmatimonadaceae bacterium]